MRAIVSLLMLHAGSAPQPHDLWTGWSADPVAHVLLGTVAWVYWSGVRRTPGGTSRRRSAVRRRALAMTAGLITLWIALLSPLDAVADALFSVHMVQHLLLVLVAAPLIVAGMPVLTCFRAMPQPARRRVARWWAARPVPRRVFTALIMPAVAVVLHSLALWLWHIPALYDAAVRDRPTHLAEHATFFWTAALFWWPVMVPTPRLASVRRMKHEVQLMAGVLAVAVQATALGAVLTLAQTPFYDVHVVTTRPWGLTQLEDQQLAGALMWMPASLPYLAALLILGARRLHSASPTVVSHRHLGLG